MYSIQTKGKDMYPRPFCFNNLFMNACINSGSKGVAVVRAVVRVVASQEWGPGFDFGSLLCTESFFFGFSGIFSPSNNLVFTGS